MKRGSPRCFGLRHTFVALAGILSLLTLATAPVTGAPAKHPLIGPFYTGDPEGLVMIPNPRATHPVAYRVGIGWVVNGHYQHGYGRVTAFQWHLKAMRWGRKDGISRMYWLIANNNALHVDWQRVKGNLAAVASISVKHPLQVVLECVPAWSGYGAAYRATANQITGVPQVAGSALPGFDLSTLRHADGIAVANSAKSFGAAVLHGSSPAAAKAAPYVGLIFHVTPQHPLTFMVQLTSAQINRHKMLATVRELVRRGWSAYRKLRPYATGDWGNFISPIGTASDDGIVYLPPLRNISGTISRGWCLPQSCIFFEWDTFFNSLLLSVNDRSASSWLMRRQLAGIFHFQMPDGLVCNYYDWHRNIKSIDRSEPPVAAMCVWQEYQRWPNKRFLKEFYKPLVRYHHWWFAISPHTHLPRRDGNKDGLLEWGSSTGVWQCARWESGMDDSPMYVKGKVKMMPSSDTFDLDDVGLNSLWAADAMYLSKIAAVLGHKKAAAHYEAERRVMAARINAMLWSHRLGMYCNRYWSRGPGHHLLSRRWSPTNFYPMIAKVPDAARAQRMLAVLVSKKYFWGKWVLPTISRNNPAFVHQEYWRGDIWGPTNYLAFQGLLNYAPAPVIHAYARKSVKLFMRNWTRKGIWSENYLATTGIASHDPHYGWGALLPTIGLQAICDITPDNKVRLDGTWNLHAKLYNIPVLGYRYEIVVKPELTEMLRHGHVVASAANKVEFLTLPQRPM
jgi:hypothetical protein